MIFYHGTTEENWQKIQQEGILWGIRNTPSRCTYLAIERKHTEQYGCVILGVEYDPVGHSQNNNYVDGCWQFRVYDPIPIEHIEIAKKMIKV